MKSDNVIIVGTQYSLLLALLFLDFDRSYIILSNRLDTIINIKAFNNNYYITNLYLKKRGVIGISEYILYLYQFHKKITELGDVNYYASSHLIETKILRKKYSILEDGTFDYMKKKKETRNIIKDFFRAGCRIDNSAKYSEKAYLTRNTDLAIPFEILNLNELWKKKTKEEKTKILSCFYIDENFIKKLKKKKIILFTQPLSEDKILSEEEKLLIYKKIVNKYNVNDIILKKHPREKTNYSLYFKEVLIIDKKFPAEIYNLMDITFEKGVTLFSTAVLNIKSKEIDFYGTEIHPKLLKKFGSMDHIIKRNKFL